MRAFLNWRYYALLLLGFVAIIGIFGVPADDSPTWFGDLILSKIIGASAGYAMYRLIEHWSKNNLIPELDKLTEDEEDDSWE